MIVERRMIIVQIMIYFILLFWTISLPLSIQYNTDAFNAIRFGSLVILGLIVFLIYRKLDKKLITIDDNHLKKTKNIIGFYLLVYFIQVILNSYFVNYQVIIYIISTVILVAVAAIGIFINFKILNSTK